MPVHRSATVYFLKGPSSCWYLDHVRTRYVFTVAEVTLFDGYNLPESPDEKGIFYTCSTVGYPAKTVVKFRHRVTGVIPGPWKARSKG